MGGQGYTIKRNVSFSKEIIWEAWTDPDAFGTWFGTDKLKMKDVKLDVRVGGDRKGTVVMPDGPETHWMGAYRSLDKPNKLVMSITDAGVLTGNLELYTLTLEGQGQKTHPTPTQAGGNPRDEEYKGAQRGPA